MSDLTLYQSELEPERAKVDEALAKLRDLVITTDAALTWAGDTLKHAKTRAKELDAKRLEVTRPIMTAKAAIDGLFNPLIERYEEAERILKAKIAARFQAIETERRALMVASAAEHAAGGTPTAIIPEPAAVQGVSVRKVLDFEIVNPALVPRDLCSPDVAKVRAAIKLGEHEIPGVRVFERDQVAARTGKP